MYRKKKYNMKIKRTCDGVSLISLPVLFWIIVLIAGFLVFHVTRHKKPPQQFWQSRSRHFKAQTGRMCVKLFLNRWWRFSKKINLEVLWFYNYKHSSEDRKECCGCSLCPCDVGVWLFNCSYSFSLLSVSLSIGIVFSFVCGLYVFWLRSYDKTGVGCDDCTWPR